MNFLTEHKTKQARMFQIPVRALQKGMIISFRYTNKKGEAKGDMMLVLNPEYKSKVHALSLSSFSSRKLNELADKVGLTFIPKYSIKGIDLEKLKMDISSNRFYGAFLGDVKKEYNDAYRTYFINKMTTTFIVDYKFQ
tara:strand:+ start:196 stop:609 length:414 start_codon:yes stop_codon:yes gene_type:complete